MRHPSLSALLLAAVTTLALTACSPEPEPTPAPTSAPSGFASEDEALRAAEATYRAYVDALNQVDLADPSTFEPVYAWLTGDALADEKESLTRMSQSEWRVSGTSDVKAFFTPHGEGSLHFIACLDVSDVALEDQDGTSVVGADRRDIYALDLLLVNNPRGIHGLLISGSEAVEDPRCG